MAAGSVQIDEVNLNVLQDKSISFDWTPHIIKQMLHGRSSTISCMFIKYYHEYLITNHQYDLEDLPQIAIMFTEKIIKKERILSRGSKFTWKKIECSLLDEQDTTVEYVLAVPDNKDIKKLPKYKAIDLYIVSEFNAAMNFAWDMNFTFSGKLFIWEGLYRNVKMRSLFNMIYVEEIDFPCLLMPECLGLQAELIDHKLDVKGFFDLLSTTWTTPYLLDMDDFSETSNVGSGASGTCKFLEVKESAVVPKCALLLKTKFVAKEIKILQSKSSNSESSSCTITSSPRTQILKESCAIYSMGAIRNPNIVKPCKLEIKDFFNSSLVRSQPFMLFKNEMNGQRLFATMEYVEGKDVSRIPIRTLSEQSKLLIVLKVAETLNIFHENGYIHNDIHLGNVRLTEDSNDVTIIDLGCCEKLTEYNVTKDINSLVKITFRLYQLSKSTETSFVNANVPQLLRPFVLDRIANIYKNSNYKKMNEIMESFSMSVNGIVLERRFLDFGFYLQNALASSNTYKEFLCLFAKYARYYQDESDSDVAIDTVNSHSDVELLEIELAKQFTKEQEHKLLRQKEIALNSIQFPLK